MRADEHEGVLNDSDAHRRAEKVQARANQILHHDLAEMTESGSFLRWFGKYAYPAVMQNFPVNNGSTLAHFMGRRELVLQIIDEMEKASPGFLMRVLAARKDYEAELSRAAHKET